MKSIIPHSQLSTAYCCPLASARPFLASLAGLIASAATSCVSLLPLVVVVVVADPLLSALRPRMLGLSMMVKAFQRDLWVPLLTQICVSHQFPK